MKRRYEASGTKIGGGRENIRRKTSFSKNTSGGAES